LRIDVIVLISGLDKEVLEKRRRAIKAYASDGTEVKMVLTDGAPPSVESFAELEMAAPGILKKVIECEREGADAIVIWGGHDPSLTSAREQLR
jgi:Asp/Glu/hydantoin racemase